MGSTVKQFYPYHQHLAKTRVFSVISELELDHIKSQKLHEQQYQQNISALQPISLYRKLY
ncbi:variant-silencing SET domain-containing protein-like [Aphis craccivora]|uniref:Variant-silencing SET domain-containing protein-like n=1 Tax=Aphis craccivora TaxID=307492 RepID=A0A6G0Y854_APHCR|nr:variant-silencing SET domain-containing protein-like [Aphis craccivora]